MEDVHRKLKTILNELRDSIIDLINTDALNGAKILMEQYIKISPNNEERFTLEAMIYINSGDIDGAENILKEGLTIHPLSFDLLYNLGYIFEHKEDYLNAYHFYMKARYIAKTELEKMDIGKAIKGLVGSFKTVDIPDDDGIKTAIIIGKMQLSFENKIETLLKRRDILNAISNNIGKNLSTVLEIGFLDGIIGKNLNYYGYDVTAVDRKKERILNVMSREIHDNLLYQYQDVAKFYSDQIDMDWMEKIPEFQIIIAVADNNVDSFNIDEKDKKRVLELLLKKAKYQLFLRVSKDYNPKEFQKRDLLNSIKPFNYDIRLILEEEEYELYLISKNVAMEGFSIPKPLDIENSKSIILDVELDKCTDMYGASYVDDFQHFVQVLKQYEENPDLKYENSVLKDYYDMFQPRNLEQGLFGMKGNVIGLRKGWIGYPWYLERGKTLNFTSNIGETRKGGNHHFGPNTDEFGENELRRLIKLYDYLKEHGYHPELFSDGYVTGYLLIKNDDYRFRVSEGQHRMACLTVLGYKTIRARFSLREEYPRIVKLEDIKKWPQVENKVYSRNLARRVFNRFFEDNVGRDRYLKE